MNVNKLSIIIPCYNEINTIADSIMQVRKADLGDIIREIIIVDDGSTDGTVEFLESLNSTEVKVFFHNNNFGKGFAIRTALKHINGDLVVIHDADLEYDPQDFMKMINLFSDESVQVVYGSRNLNKSNERSSYLFSLGGIILSQLTNILYGSDITDEATCYKMFRTRVLCDIDLECTGFEFCPEVTAKILKANISIYEVPITYIPRQISEGKKIKYRDGIVAIGTLLKYRFFD